MPPCATSPARTTGAGFTRSIPATTGSTTSTAIPRLATSREVSSIAVLSVANARIEAALVDAVEAGVRSVTIFGSAYLEGDTAGSNLKDRLQGIAKEAGLLVIGANCMGYVNYSVGARVTWMSVPEDGWFDPGHISLITHSGTCFITLQFTDPRHRHNLCISAGQELTVTAADYIDYALDKESTRVIALFLETVRDPDAFRAALDRAAKADVPVVAIKVGRTGRSAELGAQSFRCARRKRRRIRSGLRPLRCAAGRHLE